MERTIVMLYNFQLHLTKVQTFYLNHYHSFKDFQHLKSYKFINKGVKDGCLLVNKLGNVKFVKSMLNPMKDNGEALYRFLFLPRGKQRAHNLFLPLLPMLMIVLSFTIFYNTM
jgi:hypothetical protein